MKVVLYVPEDCEEEVLTEDEYQDLKSELVREWTNDEERWEEFEYDWLMERLNAYSAFTLTAKEKCDMMMAMQKEWTKEVTQSAVEECELKYRRIEKDIPM